MKNKTPPAINSLCIRAKEIVTGRRVRNRKLWINRQRPFDYWLRHVFIPMMNQQTGRF